MSKLSAAPAHRVLIALLALALASPAAAADKAPKSPKTAAPKTTATAPSADASQAQMDAMMAEMAKYATPGPIHNDFMKPLEGTWKTVQTTYMGQEPQTSEGTCTRKMIMGGRFLESTHAGSFAGTPFEGMELLGFDMRKNTFSDVWIDNMGTSMAFSTGGTYDPATKTLTMQASMDDPMTGKPTPFKMVVHVVDANKHTFSMIGTRDGKDFTEMEMTYTRVQ